MIVDLRARPAPSHRPRLATGGPGASMVEFTSARQPNPPFAASHRRIRAGRPPAAGNDRPYLVPEPWALVSPEAGWDAASGQVSRLPHPWHRRDGTCSL